MDRATFIGLLLAVAIILAGCTTDDTLAEAPEDDEEMEFPLPSGGQGSPAGRPTVDHTATACRQLHAVFPVPTSGWNLPAGFEPEPLDPAGATAAMLVAVSRCEGLVAQNLTDTTYNDAWVLLQVTVPTEHQDDGVDSDFWVLRGLVERDDILDVLARAGVEPVRAGRIVHTGTDGGGLYSLITAHATHQVGYTAIGGSGDFGPESARYWFGDGPTLRGYLAVNATVGSDQGTGAATLETDDPLLPGAASGFAHRVDGVDASFQLVRVDGQP